MLYRLFRRNMGDVLALFNGHFVEVKALYALMFDQICCVTFIGDIDTTKAYAFLVEHRAVDILRTYQHSYFDHGKQKMFFNNTIFILRSKRIIELGNNYCQMLHAPSHLHGLMR